MEITSSDSFKFSLNDNYFDPPLLKSPSKPLSRNTMSAESSLRESRASYGSIRINPSNPSQLLTNSNLSDST